MQVPLLRLKCGCNSYEWGKVGKDSAAARYASATDLTIEEDKPYAELWMGTHPSNPSSDFSTGRSLLDLVSDNSSLLSSKISQRYNSKLPFLFKVLSCAKALSIQAHPNKTLAEKLHADDPEHYPDDNHKPEMTIAITPFDGLCGFRPLGEIRHFLQTVPSLRHLVGEGAAGVFERTIQGQEEAGEGTEKMKENKEALRLAFSSLMKAKKEIIEEAAPGLIKQAKEEGESFAGGGEGTSNTGKEMSDLVQRLDGQFPGDIGLFVLFFLNYVKLEVGEAMFLRADDIHAYLSGDIMECMAASDNVIRAGFTPKFKDVDTLTSSLTYSYAPIDSQKMQPQPYPHCTFNSSAFKSDSTAMLYDPTEIEEFAVVRTELKSEGAKCTFEGIEGPSIVICTGGKGRISVGKKTEGMEEGWVYFVGATAEVVLEAEGSEPFITFKAFCELEDGKDNGGGKGEGESKGKM